ncbi:hypothetical protein GCM10027048_32990 [Hymenobacter coalescens]
MRKQLYYALATLVLGTAATPETSHAEALFPVSAPAAAPATLDAADAVGSSTLNKRKKRKKRRATRRRRHR